jgi:hypothetical protein
MLSVMTIFQLYLDNTGSRSPDKRPRPPRRDGMDHFALGGVLVRKQDVDVIFRAHGAFCATWDIDYPLHSSEIRGKRSNFAWLASDPEREADFLADLERFVLSLPIIGFAAVVHRPGYVARYRERYADNTWLMCKTAFSILVERSAKFARAQGGRLEVYFEQAGKQEDKAIKSYGRALKSEGMPFDRATSALYGALQADEFRDIIIGEPRERTKKTPMMQVADLILYPIAKAGYDPAYAPYRTLFEHAKVIDALLPDGDRAAFGVKYSCFDPPKHKDPAFAGS